MNQLKPLREALRPLRKVECGDCRLCCKVMDVQLSPEVHKKSGEWCSHCSKSAGCRVYAERPKPCREFECAWLQIGFADELRPDRCHAVITQWGQMMQLHVDRGYPGAWRLEPLAGLLRSADEKMIPVAVGIDGRVVHANRWAYAVAAAPAPVGKVPNDRFTIAEGLTP